MITRYDSSNKIADITTSKPTDTGWVDVPWSSSFKNYQDDANNRLRVRRVGNCVEIYGVAAPTADIPYSTSTTIMATLPEQFLPDVKQVMFVQQGSGIARWLFGIYSSTGNLVFSRYGDSAGKTCTTSNWLPIYATYVVGGSE